MELVSFAPGLEALGKLFETQGKMQVDLFERTKKAEEENKILKFNNLAYSSLNQATNEKELLEKSNLLTSIAQEQGIYNSVGNLINNYANNRNNLFKIQKEEKTADTLLEEYKTSGGYKVYNGQITHSKDIINDIKGRGIDSKIALDIFTKLDDKVQLQQTVQHQNGKYMYVENLRGNDTEAKGITR